MATPIPTRQLGGSKIEVPALGLGLMGLSTFYGPPLPDSERFKLLDAAHDAGSRFWDTADLYYTSSFGPKHYSSLAHALLPCRNAALKRFQC